MGWDGIGKQVLYRELRLPYLVLVRPVISSLISHLLLPRLVLFCSLVAFPRSGVVIATVTVTVMVRSAWCMVRGGGGPNPSYPKADVRPRTGMSSAGSGAVPLWRAGWLAGGVVEGWVVGGGEREIILGIFVRSVGCSGWVWVVSWVLGGRVGRVRSGDGGWGPDQGI